MGNVLLLGIALCSACVTRQDNEPTSKAKLERQFRGVWQSREFATNDHEFASYTNLTIYIYRMGRIPSGDPMFLAEVVGLFVYRRDNGEESYRFPMQLTYDNRIRVGWFMEGIYPHYRFERGLLVLEIKEGSYYYKAKLRKISDDPGDPQKFLPFWALPLEEDLE